MKKDCVYRKTCESYYGKDHKCPYDCPLYFQAIETEREKDE